MPAPERAQAPRMACRCDAYPFPHRAKAGDCCGCESAPDCHHWTRIPDYYGTGDHINVRYERVDK